MKNPGVSVHVLYSKIDLRAVLFGLLAMIAAGAVITAIMGVLTWIFDPDFFRRPHSSMPPPNAWLASAMLIAACGLGGGFTTGRIAKQAPVFNAMIIPAIETVRKFFILVVFLMHGKLAFWEPATQRAPLMNLALFIACSCIGAQLAMRFSRKAPTASQARTP